MDSYPESNTTSKPSVTGPGNQDEVVYKEQVAILYRQIPRSLLTLLVIAPLFSFILWDYVNKASILIWLSLVYSLAACSYFLWRSFNKIKKNDFNVTRWESYFVAGVGVAGLLWGGTAFWLEQQSPVLHQLSAIFILTGLSSCAIVSLSPRPIAFRVFLLSSMLPYIFKFTGFGLAQYYALSGLMILFLAMMLFISKNVSCVLRKALLQRHKNTELLHSYQESNKYNKKVNEALFDFMRKNKAKGEALEESEIFLRSILITANDGIITTDKNGIILAVNHAIERDFGYTEQELLGKSINIIMSDNMGPQHDRYMQEYLKDEKPTLIGRMLDVMGKRKDGSLFPIELTVSEARLADEIYFTGIIRDITERRDHEKMVFDMMQELADAKIELEEANAQLQHHNIALTKLTEHDSLTGLHNRRYLMKTFKREWTRHQRNKKPISVILLDIDFFKLFNDKHGHQAGDECLKQIARALANSIERPADVIARYGGEEFLAILPETNLDGAFHIAERMRKAVETLQIRHDGSDITDHVTVSAGVASVQPVPGNNYERLIKNADDVLYEAKHCGRNCVRKHNE